MAVANLALQLVLQQSYLAFLIKRKVICIILRWVRRSIFFFLIKNKVRLEFI